MDKRNKLILVFKIIVLVIIITLIVIFSIKSIPIIEKMVSNPRVFAEDLSKYIKSNGAFGIIIYILYHIVQVVIAIIPGEVIQMAGGYIFGMFWGMLYTEVGIILGTLIVFYMVKFLGYSIIKMAVPEKIMKKFEFVVNSEKAELVLFFLFLIPGFPKDMLTYISGLTPIKPLRFFVITIVARFPGMFGSVYIGSKLYSKDYFPVIVVGVVSVLLFLAAVIFQERIIETLSRKKK